MAAAILKMASGAMSDILTSAGRECNTLSGAARNLCIVKMKIDAIETQIKTINSKSRLCNQSRDVDKCRNKIKEKRVILQTRLKRLKEQESIYIGKQITERNKEKRSVEV